MRLRFAAIVALGLLFSNARVAPAADIDTDGIPDEIDPCLTTLGMYTSSLHLNNVGTNTEVGDESMAFKGIFTFPTQMQFVDPVLTGIRILIYSNDAEVLSDVVIPPGLSWRVDRETIEVLLHKVRARLRDPAGTYGGIRRIRLDGASSPIRGFIKIRVVARNGSYPAGTSDTPLRVVFIIGDGRIGECGHAPITPGEWCGFKPGEQRLRCEEPRIRGD